MLLTQQEIINFFSIFDGPWYLGDLRNEQVQDFSAEAVIQMETLPILLKQNR